MDENEEKNTSNSSGESVVNDRYSEEYVLLLSLLAAVIILINLMVIFLYGTVENLRTKTNTLLASLALSDILNGLVVIPLQILVNIHTHIQSLRLASMVFYRFIAVSTMLHILAVTLERHVCILSPLRYHTLVTKYRVLKILVLIWFVSTANSVISLSWITLADEYNHLKQPPGLHNSKLLRFEFAYTVFTLCCFFVTPLVIMTYSFRKILREISRHNRRDSALMLESSVRSCSETGNQEELRTPNQTTIPERKPILIFLTMLIVFSVTWSSWYAQILILSISPMHYKPVGGIWPAFVRSSTSVMNPLLYALIKKDFRQPLKRWLRRVRNLASGSRKKEGRHRNGQNTTMKITIES